MFGVRSGYGPKLLSQLLSPSAEDLFQPATLPGCPQLTRRRGFREIWAPDLVDDFSAGRLPKEPASKQAAVLLRLPFPMLIPGATP